MQTKEIFLWIETISKSLVLEVWNHGKRNWLYPQVDSTLFYKHSTTNKIAILIVYVEDIILTDDDSLEFKSLREKLAKVFEIKELGPLKYFLEN